MIKNFITFEGGEGTGKSSIINEISKYLKDKNIDFLLTREPGGVEISEEIRNIILDKKNTKMDPKCEALLYAASRVQHLNEKIIPAIKENKLVLCDRYVDSSLAYQGYGRKIGVDEVMQINQFALEYLPIKTFYIDVMPEIALERIKKNNRTTDRLDLESLEFHHKVYEGYQQLIKKFSDRIVKIDGNRPLNEIVLDIIKEINKLLYE